MILIRRPVSKEDFKGYYALRYQVLREPWGESKGTEKDDFEPISEHFMAVDEASNQIVGVVKIFEKAPGVGNFSHLAVHKNFQKQGIGRMLVDTVEKTARAKGYTLIGTMTRLTSTAFFEKLGYQIAGIPTAGFGTVHMVWMEKKLEG